MGKSNSGKPKDGAKHLFYLFVHRLFRRSSECFGGQNPSGIWGRGGHRAPSLIYVVEKAPLNKRRKEFTLSSWWPLLLGMMSRPPSIRSKVAEIAPTSHIPLPQPLLSPPPTWARLPPRWLAHGLW